ncbi:MAG: hypothetical protein J6Z46_02595 [Lachnospiraceae bacterium]|nr:hypothetical protein [Lachnospiraceae bacterium]
MKKKTAILLVAAMLLGLTACGEEKPVEQQQPLPTPEPIVQTQKVTATPTPVVTKDWSKNMAPTFTPTPSPTMTPEEIAAYEAELAKNETVDINIDLSTRKSQDGGIGTQGDDGSVKWTAEDTLKKNILLFGRSIPAGKYIVTVKYSFNGNTDLDPQARFYFTDDAGNANTTVTYGFLENVAGEEGVVKEVKLKMETNGDCSAFIFGGHAYGEVLDEFTLYSVNIQKDPTVAVDLASRSSLDGGLGTQADDGSVTWTAADGLKKNVLLLQSTIPAGKYIVKVKYSFNGNTELDPQARFYFTSAAADANCTVTMGFLTNVAGEEKVVKEDVMYMESNADAVGFVFGGHAYGEVLDEFTLYSVEVTPDRSVTVDLAGRVSLEGGTGTDNDDGSVTWTAADGLKKNALPFTNTIPAGKYTVIVKFSFNSSAEVDPQARFYFTSAMADANVTTTMGFLENTGAAGEVLEAQLSMESNAEAAGFVFGGHAWGEVLDEFTLYSVTVVPQ